MSMVAKRWRFERVLPTLTICFGAITLGGGFINTYGGLAATRLILGLFQGCLFPCVALFSKHCIPHDTLWSEANRAVANWYKREEMAVRMGFIFGKLLTTRRFVIAIADMVK